MLQDMWNAPPGFRPTKSAPSSPAKPLSVSRTRSESFHITHKVPVGDTPYVRAKNVQVRISSSVSSAGNSIGKTPFLLYSIVPVGRQGPREGNSPVLGGH